MNGLYSCIIAISMYSKIPMPNVEWSEDRMRYVMCFFPLVGIVQGAALGLWLHFALDVLNLSVGAAALTGAAIPDRKSTRLNSSHSRLSRMPSSA